MKKKYRLLYLAAFPLLLLRLTACGQQPEKQPEHTHKWEPATCSRGEFCFGCGETRGQALEHSWVPATCDKTKHCTLCGKIEGNALHHTSDGNGTCTVCKQELNPRVLLNGARPENTFIVYDGAVLSFPFWEAVGLADRETDAGRFGKEYRVYDQAGTLVAQGEWVQEYYNTTKTDTGWNNHYYHDTEYIPLFPGIYRVEYSCYESYTYKDNGNRPVYIWDKYAVPKGELLHSYNMLEVR